MNSRDLELTRLASLIVSDICEIAGWATTNSDIVSASSVAEKLASPRPLELARVTTQRAALSATPWCAELVTHSFTFRELDAVRKGIQFLRNAGKLAPGPATVEILEKFGVE